MKPNAYFDGVMWQWFGLSYSSYLVMPRSLLCGMPKRWQRRMVKLLQEAEQAYETDSIDDNYVVSLRDEGGRFKHDPLADYKYPPKLPYREKRSLWKRMFGWLR